MKQIPVPFPLPLVLPGGFFLIVLFRHGTKKIESPAGTRCIDSMREIFYTYKQWSLVNISRSGALPPDLYFI